MTRIFTLLLLTSCAINAMDTNTNKDANNQLTVQCFDVKLFSGHAGSMHAARTDFIRNGLGKHVVLKAQTKVTNQEEAHPQPGYEIAPIRKKYSYDDVEVTIDQVNKADARVRYTHTYDAWKHTPLINWFSWIWPHKRTETVTLPLGESHESVFCTGETPDEFGSKFVITSGNYTIPKAFIRNPAALVPLKCAIAVAYHFRHKAGTEESIRECAIPFDSFELLTKANGSVVGEIEHPRYIVSATLLAKARDAATISCKVKDKQGKRNDTREVIVPLQNNFDDKTTRFTVIDDVGHNIELHVRTFQGDENE